MPPILSIIISAFNEEQFVAEAIHSAQAQTVRDTEILVIDDNSTDGTRAVIEALARKDVRVRLIVNTPENAGVCGARNLGLRAASGRYTGFLDADDLWHPERAARHIAFMEEHPEVDLTFSQVSRIDERGQELGRVMSAPRKRTPTFVDLLVENTIISPICRTSACVRAGLFDQTLRVAEDLDFWLRIARLRDGNLRFIDGVLYFYRIHDGQATKNWKQMAHDWDIVFERYRAEFPDRIKPIENEAKARHLRYRAFLAYQAGDFAAARQQLFAAFTRGSFPLLTDRRTWLTTAAVLATLLPARLHRTMANAAQATRSKLSRRYWAK